MKPRLQYEIATNLLNNFKMFGKYDKITAKE
jgi:hypothetical protein